MTQNEKLLNEEDSAKHSGVSIETLKQYKKFGLLEGVEKEEKTFYKEIDLDNFFRISSKKLSKSEPQAEQEKPEETDTKETIDTLEVEEIQAAEVESTIEPPEKIQLTNAKLSVENKTLSQQVETLKQERDWLRQRLENLEIKSEREQMLRLSDTETIRRLLEQSSNKKSFWNFSLPWIKS